MLKLRFLSFVRVCVCVCARARKWSLVGAFFTRLIFEELEEEFVFKKDRCSHTKNESIDCFETPGARRVSSFQTGKGCTFSRFKKCIEISNRWSGVINNTSNPTLPT
jgi:hypothetical protein